MFDGKQKWLESGKNETLKMWEYENFKVNWHNNIILLRYSKIISKVRNKCFRKYWQCIKIDS